MATAQDLQGIGLQAEAAMRLGWQTRSVATTAATQGSAGGRLTGRGNQLIAATFTTSGDAVTLPVLAAVGDEVLINNVSANPGVIFPPAGGNVNGEATNASMVIAAQGSAGCVIRAVKVSSLRWAAVASGAASIPFGANFVAAGDSITAQGSFSATATDTVQMLNTGYWTWAYNTDGRIVPNVGSNAGVGGNTAAQLLTRYDADVIARAPKIVLILIGTNDIVSVGRLATAIIADIDAMIVKNRAIGAKTILGKVLPRGSIASPMTAPQIAEWVALNAFIAARAASDIRIWDAESLIGDMNANHTMLPGHSISDDFLHINDLGAQKVSTVVSAAIASIVAPGNGLFTTNNAAGNFCGNGFMTGTGGSAGSGASGVVADSWAATGVIAGGATMVCSKVARPAGGEWQQVALSGTYNGSGLASDVSRSISMSASIGQKLTVEAAFEIDAAAVGLASISAIAQFSDGTSVECMASTASAVNLPGPITGVLRSMPCVATGSITSATIRLRTYMVNVGAPAPVAITSRIGAVGVKVVT